MQQCAECESTRNDSSLHLIPKFICPIAYIERMDHLWSYFSIQCGVMINILSIYQTLLLHVVLKEIFMPVAIWSIAYIDSYSEVWVDGVGV